MSANKPEKIISHVVRPVAVIVFAAVAGFAAQAFFGSEHTGHIYHAIEVTTQETNIQPLN